MSICFGLTELPCSGSNGRPQGSFSLLEIPPSPEHPWPETSHHSLLVRISIFALLTGFQVYLLVTMERSRTSRSGRTCGPVTREEVTSSLTSLFHLCVRIRDLVVRVYFHPNSYLTFRYESSHSGGWECGGVGVKGRGWADCFVVVGSSPDLPRGDPFGWSGSLFWWLWVCQGPLFPVHRITSIVSGWQLFGTRRVSRGRSREFTPVGFWWSVDSFRRLNVCLWFRLSLSSVLCLCYVSCLLLKVFSSNYGSLSLPWHRSFILILWVRFFQSSPKTFDVSFENF